jgi:inositol-1,3,4-trisphosphate 5/6-kinase/inositol-tetrakisphosphate 1-kinase
MTRLSTTTTTTKTDPAVWNYNSVVGEPNCFDGPCHHEHEDLDSSQSNHSLYSFSERMNKPIVVGYAFGPKKMSTMGVVLAEASRVKVIHEELKEDKHDDDEQHEEEEEEEQQQHHEIDEAQLFGCEPQQHTDPSSMLTSAALRGLEEQTTGRNRSAGNHNAPKSTIITLGNSNNTDLQHIVRYFRSNCSSAAASASIASMGETTVSTPTTTNSCSTYSNYKQNRRNSTSSSSRGEWNRFPVQISFVPLDPDQPLEEQHGGKFDLILHKLTEDILTCSLMQDNMHSKNKCSNSNSQSQQEEMERQQRILDPSLRRVRALRDYCYHRNPNCCLVDDPKHVQTLMSRSEIANVLQRCLKDVKTTSGISVKSPRFVVVPECSEQSAENDERDPPQQQYQTRDLVQALQDNNQGDGSKLSTPLIVKPLIAAGTKQSHYMLIAIQESALAKLPPKSIVQEFVNHDATLYKVYVLGDFVNVYKRHSLPNLPSDLSEATVDMVKFDSQRPYPKLKDFGIGIEDASDCNNYSIPQSASTVTREEVKPIVEVLKRAFGLELFGFDILMGSNNGDCFVVDVNYFPSYKEVPDFPSLLAQYLTQRVLEHRRKGRMCNNSQETSSSNNSRKKELCGINNIKINDALHLLQT